MIEKVVKKGRLEDLESPANDLAYWLTKTPEERIAAVDHLRRQYYGSGARLERTARVIQRKSR
jgi:hypothetical protein